MYMLDFPTKLRSENNDQMMLPSSVQEHILGRNFGKEIKVFMINETILKD